MKLSATSGTLLLASLAGSAFGVATYTKSERIAGEDFYNSFNFEAIADPTHGRVNYVDQETAVNLGLTFAIDDTFFLRADDTTVLSASGPGRNSVRIRSNKKYTTHVAVFDILHMPQGCGTWPAVWETNESNWPQRGEVDILEGVNDVIPNQSALHASPNCSIPATGVNQLGTTISTNCDATVNYNQGCVVDFSEDGNSFGPNFNRIGGGWYAMERTNDYISVWFWERGDRSAPYDVISGAPHINTSKWGTPSAYFPNTDCDLASHFGPNNIIINLTFCGDRAGNSDVYTASGCPSTCVDYVNNNPAAFADAYFQFASINIYT
ncbi:glycoside hydrolase family 16 protein [Paxillus rubicundulus Ve08.2h10]|uniref:Glycoside hydrolase family 16 protein n=1 Tax=Paxillus rubicundulus Ve08.2h10 TaxID=930991 RepID=A0A0D0D0J6_9AGAM|nr:glycoside hydrolase family 16 protein [Paxillus rubicundulus Ve08.2h10]